jgi:ADP-ribose pyrophosphatase YjhB (NUDIX family)
MGVIEGFVDYDEFLESAAEREALEETGEGLFGQFNTCSVPNMTHGNTISSFSLRSLNIPGRILNASITKFFQ